VATRSQGLRMVPGGGWEESRWPGLVLPGLCNLHSHAFQVLLTGRTQERGGGPGGAPDSFWTWRERMYALAGSLGPDELEKVGAWLYARMLAHGFTHVVEFHYLHQGGAEMGAALLRAAKRVGMGITLLPVLYLHAGPGEELAPRQAPFALPGGVEGYLRVYEELASLVEPEADQVLGFAPHSLRAVAPEELEEALRALLPNKPPIHIHIAEQRREVEEIQAAYGAPPVRWLLENAPVDSSWCLVHATHLGAGERKDLAGSGATLGLCPSTEADLGDGVFPLPEFLEEGGSFGIGTDGQVGLCPAQELRLLEFEQRLRLEERNVLAGNRAPRTHVGRFLVEEALGGGRRAAGLGPPASERGSSDFILLDSGHPLLEGAGPDQVLDAWIFHLGAELVREVWKGDKCLVQEGRHALQEDLDREIREVLRP